jgi:GntR family transcriptional regulator
VRVLLIELVFESDIPIYLQLRNQIVKGIATGGLLLGESLPTVRQLADDAGVNPMTVNKAYGLLKQEGFIVIDRRHGAKVADLLPQKSGLRDDLEAELVLILCEAKLGGMNEDEVVEKIRHLYRQLV